MLDLLKEYLDVNTSPEEANHVAMADRFLERIEDDNYEHVIEEILMTDQEMDSGTVIQTLVAVYRNQLYYFFAQHALIVSDELNLAQLTDLANGIIDLQGHEQLAKLFELSDEEAPATERLCAMLTQTTRFNADELLLMLEDVSDTFLVRLKALTQVEEPDSDEELGNARERLMAYRKYMGYLNSAGGVAPRLEAILRSGGGPGMPFIFYVKLIDGQQPLDTLTPKAVAWELFGAALVSEDGYGNPAETVKAVLEQFISDTKNVANVMVEIRQVQTGYK